MSWGLLNQLLHGAHDVEMIICLDHLKDMLGGIRNVKHLETRPNHFSCMHNKILRLFLHVVKEEAMDMVQEDVHCHVCSDRIL